MSIVYVRNAFPDAVYSHKPVPRRGMMQSAPGQGQDGYGKKITSDYMVTINKKIYRIYATCFSNCASHWVEVNGQRYHVGDFDIPDYVRQGKSCQHENTGVSFGIDGKTVSCIDCKAVIYRGQGGPTEDDPAIGC